MKKNNVFISHKGIDDDSVQKLKEVLVSEGYNISNDSIESAENHEQIQEEETIKRLFQIGIDLAEIFICLIDENTHSDEWADFGIEQAHLKGKRIVGIYASGSEGDIAIPSKYKKYGGPILSLNSLDNLGSILQGENIPNETPEGKPSQPLYISPPRVKC